MDVGRCGNAGGVRHEFANAFDIQCVFGRQEMSQRVGHRVLTFVSRKVQNLHVHLVSHFFGVRVSQRVPCHTKNGGRKHLFTILIVGEGTGLPHQRIDDVPIVDVCQIFADQPRHRLNVIAMMSDDDLFGTDSQIDEIADQPTGNGIRVGSHPNRAAATDTHARDDVVRVEPFVGQSLQMSQILEERFPSIVVGTFHQCFHKRNVLFATGKVSTAAKQQRLLDPIFDVSVGRFDIAIFVGAPSICAFRFTVVVIHQCRIPLGQFATTGVVSHGRRQ
jgi:hypothetical protein